MLGTNSLALVEMCFVFINLFEAVYGFMFGIVFAGRVIVNTFVGGLTYILVGGLKLKLGADTLNPV